MYGEGVARPEYVAPIDHGETLRQLRTVDDTLVEQHRPELWSIAQRVAASLVDPQQQNAVRIYAGILDWKLFGRPGDPLPEGVLKYADSDGDPKLGPDTDIPYVAASMMSKVGAEFVRHGIGDITVPLADDFKARRPEIHATLSSFMAQTAEYQLITSFEQPEPKQVNQPLNAYWQQVRKAQVTSEVRQQYAYAEDADIARNTQADHALRRALYHVEDETRPQISQPQGGKSGIERARTYFRPYLESVLNYNRADPYVIKDIFFEGEGLGDMMVTCLDSDGTQHERELTELTDYVGHFLANTTYRGPKDMQYIAGEFAGTAIRGIYQEDAQSVSQVLAEAVKSTVDYLDDKMREDYLGAYNSWPGYWPAELDLIFKSPTGPIHHDRSLPAHWEYDRVWRDIFDNRITLSTQKEIERRENQTLGYVEKYGPDSFKIGARLIIDSICEATPEISRREDVVIHLYDHKGKQGPSPFIPGYKLVSSNEYGRYGFEVDRNGDQYAPCKVPVNAERRHLLASACVGIGLDGLAQKLDVASRMTVDELVLAIASEGVYYKPGHVWYQSGENNVDALTVPNIYLESFDDFGKIVRGGKLYGQCTASAQFLKYMLDIAFPEAGSTIVGGLILEDDSPIITGSQHAQTVFSYKGRQYILDATFSSDSHTNAGPGRAGASEAYSIQASKPYRRQAAKVQPMTPSTESESPKRSTEKPPQTMAERVDGLLTSFSEHAKSAFEMPNDRMLGEFLVKLPPQDPARRAYELLRQFKSGRLNLEQLDAQAQYVIKTPETTREIRKRLGIDHYSQSFLEYLGSTVNYLQAIGHDG